MRDWKFRQVVADYEHGGTTIFYLNHGMHWAGPWLTIQQVKQYQGARPIAVPVLQLGHSFQDRPRNDVRLPLR